MMRIAAILVLFFGLRATSECRAVYFNAQRGYRSIGADAEGRLTKPFFLSCEGGGNVEFELRAEGCGFTVGAMQGDSLIDVRLKEESYTDPFGMQYKRPELEVRVNGDVINPQRRSGRFAGNMHDSAPVTVRMNISASGIELNWNGCEASYAIPGFVADSVGVAPEENGSLRVIRGHLLQPESSADRSEAVMTIEEIEARLRRSSRALEGKWQLLDRSMEEDLLRLGGDYRLAIVEGKEGEWNILYLSGAEINAGAWQPGALKGRLRPTDVGGLYDCEWIDAEFKPLHHSVKAQHDAALRTLTISFPYQNSTLRLIKTR